MFRSQGQEDPGVCVKKPFAVGDRVRVYGNSISGKFTPSRLGDKNIGVVATDISDEGFLGVDVAEFGIINFHFKQCRRLVKKERQRIWILETEMKDFHTSACVEVYKTQCDSKAFIEFVEVVRKK